MAGQSLETTRRAALGALTAIGALSLAGGARVAQAEPAKNTFVLVHGTWHGG